MSAMNTDMYQLLWEVSCNALQGRMALLQSRLKEDSALHNGQFVVKPVVTQTDGQEFFVSLLVEDIAAGNVPVLAARFTLHSGTGGVNVGLRIDDLLRQESTWQYMPRNIAPDCYTEDVDVLQGRIKKIPFATLVSAAREILDRLASMREEHGNDYSQVIARLL